ncbi:hypothetical protein AB0A60_32465 [Streptomyces sp. NPDC046275]|uniref:hypothetical protein n=1 Tax=Streptomyces sp. NPDC046275 TaxID=3157201 RepID=UPI0033F3B589
MGKSAWDRQQQEVVWVGAGAGVLPAGLADGRYGCRACGESLILKGTKATSKVQAHFAHRTGEGCSRPEREAALDAEDEVVIQLRDRIRAMPGVTVCTTASPGESETDPLGMPPAILVAVRGATTVVIEAPTGVLPGPETVRRRIRAVRGEHAGAEHVWFLKRNPSQFAQLAPHQVKLREGKRTHERVVPNEQQQAIAEVGGHVYWLDGKVVLVPYGIRRFRHPVQRGQQWTDWPSWRSDPRDDWLISKPRPATDADSWGLVPVAFSSLTATRGAFRPADAYAVMDELYTVQERRFAWRNKQAREIYAAAHRSEQAVEPEGTLSAAHTPMPETSGAPAAMPAHAFSPAPEPDSPPEAASRPSDASDIAAAAVDVPPRPAYPPTIPQPAPEPRPAPAGTPRSVRWWQRLRLGKSG